MGRMLTSWKEIAAYLGKGVRTVQRWETEMQLPVRRPHGRDRQIVVAFPEELDFWARRHSPAPNGAGGEQFLSPFELASRLEEQIARLNEMSRRLANILSTGQADPFVECVPLAVLVPKVFLQDDRAKPGHVHDAAMLMESSSRRPSFSDYHKSS